MTTQQIDKIIEGVVKLGMWAISAFALIQAIQVFYKERSVGKTAIGKLKDEHATIKKEFEELKREHEELSEDIESIQSKYEKLIEKILNNFPFKQ